MDPLARVTCCCVAVYAQKMMENIQWRAYLMLDIISRALMECVPQFKIFRWLAKKKANHPTLECNVRLLEQKKKKDKARKPAIRALEPIKHRRLIKHSARRATDNGRRDVSTSIPRIPVKKKKIYANDPSTRPVTHHESFANGADENPL